MNLIGPSVRGFDIFMKDEHNAPECIASCKRNYNLDHTETCFTMKIISLNPNASLFIQEMEGNTLSEYLEKSSFFGLVKIADTSM
jgi:hypothetical protein